MSKLRWTLVGLAALGGTASADIGETPAIDMGTTVSVEGRSVRGVAEDYLVMPSGGELAAQMKFITADPMLGGQPLKFTDLALFELAGRYSVFEKLELSAQVDLLPKQPSYTDEKPWQSVGAGLRSPLGKHVALSLSGGGGHLIAHEGMWTREALAIEWKKPIEKQWLSFDVIGGVDGLGITAPGVRDSAFLTELSASTSALFREPSGHWGAWLGIAYAVPVQHSGADPTTGLMIEPQPRLDFHAGTVLSIVKEWDLFADFAVIDRGDLANPATRLPILDGGFDQKQIIFGVIRHIEGTKKPTTTYDDAMAL
ncbi:MAG: hypothetical protein JO257_00495 [Deltaproteobacteria bacterium]|nr:hypothetical protein [Deltaproteobacteria bacterium]